MRCCFTGADNSPHFLAVDFVRPGVDDKDRGSADNANCLPAVSVRVRVMSRQCEGVIKNQLGSFKTDAVIDFVRPVLLVSPCPAQVSLRVAT